MTTRAELEAFAASLRADATDYRETEDRAACEKLKMGMFLAVAKGAAEEPKFIHMVYTPAKKAKKRVALIGKGLMFDSGGYSLKPSDSMFDMKVDMSGSAAVIAAMDAIATLD